MKIKASFQPIIAFAMDFLVHFETKTTNEKIYMNYIKKKKEIILYFILTVRNPMRTTGNRVFNM